MVNKREKNASFEDQVREIRDLVEIVVDKVRTLEAFQSVVMEQLRTIKDQQSLMNKKLDDPDTGLERINEKLDTNTESVVNIEQTIAVYKDMYRINDDNARKLEKRVKKLEDNAGIEAPPELELLEVS